MSNKIKIFGLICLAFPIIVLSTLSIIHYKAINAEASVKIKITGYDPRHILQGHYMRFRFDWNIQDSRNSYAYKKTELCINEDKSSRGYQSRIILQEKRYYNDCDYYIMNQSGSIKEFTDNYKYFIPQSHAPQLDKALRSGSKQFEVELSITKDGVARLKELYIDGLTVQEFAAANPQTLIQRKH